jgi:hypothetical protein
MNALGSMSFCGGVDKEILFIVMLNYGRQKRDCNVKKEPWYIHQLTQDQLELFIEKARTGKNNNKAFIGTVTPDVAQRIEAVCRKKVKNIMLESEGIRHSYKRVSHNLKGNDLLHIVDAINTAIDIKVSNTTHQNNKCLEICNDIGGKITFIMEVRIHYGGWLALVTCYRENRGGATL